MEIKSGSEWVDDKSGLDVVVESIIESASEETKVVYKLFDNTGNYLGYNSCTYEAFLVSKTPKEYIYECRYSKGYEHGVQHMKMQNSIDKYLEMSDKLSLTEYEVDNIIDESFEEGYAQAYSELQTKTERERALQEKAWDEGYDQAIDDLIEAGVIGEEEYLDEDCSDEEYSEYEFGDVEDDEEYCFSKELARVLNGEYTSNINFDGNNKEDLVNNPSHYNSDPSGVKCIEITRHRNNNIGNVIKYVWRNGLKDGNSDVQDLEKAAWYLNDEIQRLKDIK